MTVMASVAGELRVCDCCAVMVANGDDSGCRDFDGHDHKPASLIEGAAYVSGDPEEWQGSHPWLCDGCDEWLAWGSNRWPVVILD